MEVLFALGGAVVVIAWGELTHRHREVKSHRAMCNHVWDAPFEVVGTGSWKQFCVACGEQRFADPPEAEFVLEIEYDEEADDESLAG